MRDFNEIKKALWLNGESVFYTCNNKTFSPFNIPEDKVHSFAELCYRYRSEFQDMSASLNVTTRHRSPLLYNDTKSGSLNPKGLEAILNDKCDLASKYTDIYHFKPTAPTINFTYNITYKVVHSSDNTAWLKYSYETINNSATIGTSVKLSNSSVVGVYTETLTHMFKSYSDNDLYISFKKNCTFTDGEQERDFIELISIEPGDGWEWADKKEEPVLHKFSYVVNISSTPAVLKVYAKNDAIEKCSLDADKYVDTDLNKVVYTATYANGSTATIDYWSYDENEELVVYQNLNCTLGERIQSW